MDVYCIYIPKDYITLIDIVMDAIIIEDEIEECYWIINFRICETSLIFYVFFELSIDLLLYE